jgi:hypothetical protein
MPSVNTNSTSVLEIMNQQSYSMKNTDSNKTMTISSDIQEKVQQTQEAARKGTTEGYKETLYQLNVLV